MNLLAVLNGLLGIGVIIGIAFLMSNNKKRVNWRLVISGFLIQFVFAIFLLKGEAMGKFFSPLAWPKDFFAWVSNFFVLVLNFTTEGAKFVFGQLALGPGSTESLGVFFAFQVLPTIIFFASLMSVLYYLGIMQRVVQGMAWIMAKLMGTSGAESLSNSANIFVGQTEAPLMIRPFLKDLTNSELLTIMVGGMATIAGGVMAAYIQMLSSSYAETHNLPIQAAQLKFATQLLGASIMAAPASLAISKIIFPEIGEPVTKGTVKIKVEKNASNVIEAAASGASDGMKLALNVGAMLIAFIALIALANYLLEWIGNWTGLSALLIEHYNQPLSLQILFGLILQFLAFAIGVPWQEAINFGSLVGTKIVLNEFVAYLDMSAMIRDGKLVSEKAITMATFALCGFANFSSIAIQIGGISPLAPERRKDLASLGLRAVAGGALATLMTATIAGFLL
ncbi:MAG: NupC/NupG family nucleoside CNT transporter [Bacteroidetes bacterium]|nr:NupC/NupG family nucleoside CNT transporter [Bacteroidota bacterium]MBU2585029.1 NupC/NupG family nucleoside CNT transporter [Bacteroidota bacterium]